MSAPTPASAQALLELLRRRRCAPGSVVVDLACDDGGALAAALHASGLVCLGIAADQANADRLTDIGVEVVTGDLSKPDAVLGDVVLAVAERHVAAVWLADLPARVPDLDELVRAVHWFGEQTGAALTLSVPNVTHVDVGTKLLLGRWEPRPGGVLDEAHVRHFSAAALRTTMSGLGWAEVDAEDVERAASDQHFPADTVPLERTTPVGAQLAGLRQMAGPGAYATKLVRLYEAVMPEPPDAGVDADAEVPFLSVLVRTQGKRWETLQEALLCLAAQSCDDFEVLIVVHDPEPGATDEIERLVAEFHPSFSSRVRVDEVRGGGRCRPLNVGARAARGRFLATLDDDDLVFVHWVETMRAAAERAPGHVLRVGVATQQIAAAPGAWAGEDGYDVKSRPRVDYPLTFDHVDHLLDNLTPNNGYAVPRSVVTDLAQEWDESLPVLEDWDHLLRFAAICGVASVPTVAAMLRVWANAENSKTIHPPEDWEETRQRIVARYDSAPLLLDRGYVSRLRALLVQLEGVPELEQRLEQRMAQAEMLHDALERSDGEIVRLSGDVAQLNRELARVHDELGRSNDELGRSNEEVVRLSGDVAQLNGELGRVYDELGRSNDELVRLSGEVVRLSGDVAQLNGELARVHDELGLSNREVVRLSGELATSEERRRIADEAVDALETSRADLEAQLDAVYSSRSWRLTEAMRASGRLARRWAASAEELVHDRPRGHGPGGD